LWERPSPRLASLKWSHTRAAPLLPLPTPFLLFIFYSFISKHFQIILKAI